MENQLICLDCGKTGCIKIKPVNKLITIKIRDIFRWEARGDEKGCSNKRQDGCRFYLMNDPTPYETTMSRKKFEATIRETLSNEGESASMDVKIVYKSECVPLDKIVRTKTRRDVTNKKRLDGFCIVLDNGNTIETAQNIKKKVDKLRRSHKNGKNGKQLENMKDV